MPALSPDSYEGGCYNETPALETETGGEDDDNDDMPALQTMCDGIPAVVHNVLNGNHRLSLFSTTRSTINYPSRFLPSA